MTQEKILKLAYKAAWDKWNEALDRVAKNPSDSNKARERSAWADVEAIGSMIIA